MTFRPAFLLALGLPALLLLMSGCQPATGSSPSAAAPPRADATVAAPPAPSPTLPPMVVHKSASCGCCGTWVEHVRAAGFEVEVRDTDDMGPVKERLGIAPRMLSCHTAEVGGYFVEGHVPAEDIKRLLAEKPAVKGLALPGMPMGSPGMESPDGRVQPYVVSAVDADGRMSDYAHHGH